MLKQIWLMLIRQTIVVLVKVYFNFVLLQFKKNIITTYNYNLISLLINSKFMPMIIIIYQFCMIFPRHIMKIESWCQKLSNWFNCWVDIDVASQRLRIIRVFTYNTVCGLWYCKECYMWTLGVMWLYGKKEDKSELWPNSTIL